MPPSAESTNADGESIKVGTTGTVATLMSRELDSIKHLPQASSSSRRRHQSRPVSVPCGANPKKAIQRKSPNGSGSSSSNNGSVCNRSTGDAPKPRSSVHRNGCQAPILHSDEMCTGRNSNVGKVEKKGKGNGYAVEVVDLKCSNPMSSRLRKLGFSKLSESFA